MLNLLKHSSRAIYFVGHVFFLLALCSSILCTEGNHDKRKDNRVHFSVFCFASIRCSRTKRYELRPYFV